MAATATKIGQSGLTFDWTNLKANPEIPHEPTLQAAWQTLKGRFESNEIGFYNLPVTAELNQKSEAVALAKRILEAEHCTDVLFLGIGGSSLGPISLLSELREKVSSKLKFHFAENPDPIECAQTLKKLIPSQTLVCVVTKSGGTYETLALALIALGWSGEARWSSHFVAITDPKKGDLRKFATEKNIPTLAIHPSIGGRFSVLTPVGLFAAALAGLDCDELIKGAQHVREYCEKAPLVKNPLMTLGAELIRQFGKRPIHVCMPYSTCLREWADWFVQLWSESLGKNSKGFTPIAAVGATDQHSILQLLRDGPDNKITFFIAVDEVAEPVVIPKEVQGLSFQGYPAFSILRGNTLQQLLKTEYQATSLVLTKQSRPNLTVKIDSLNERNIGSLYFAFSVLTAVTGTLWDINPFDQPGVEEGKLYIQSTLEKNGAGSSSQSFGANNISGDDDDQNSAVYRLRTLAQKTQLES